MCWLQKHGHNEQQGKAIEFLLKYGKLAIQNFEVFCPVNNRRSLQRDLKTMLDKNLISSEETIIRCQSPLNLCNKFMTKFTTGS
jgi:tryptophan 2,3-dioxygenase